MPNRSTHLLVGIFAGAATYSITKFITNERFTIEGFAGSVLAGGFFGTLPDLIEPATNPNHRAFAHSFTMAAILIAGNPLSWSSSKISDKTKLSLIVSSASYLSHLVADASTPKGLPVI